MNWIESNWIKTEWNGWCGHFYGRFFQKVDLLLLLSVWWFFFLASLLCVYVSVRNFFKFSIAVSLKHIFTLLICMNSTKKIKMNLIYISYERKFTSGKMIMFIALLFGWNFIFTFWRVKKMQIFEPEWLVKISNITILLGFLFMCFQIFCIAVKIFRQKNEHIYPEFFNVVYHPIRHIPRFVL